MDINNVVLATITGKERKNVLLSVSDFMMRHVLNCGHSSDVVAASTERLLDTITHRDAWVYLPTKTAEALKARICMDKDMLEDFLSDTVYPDQGKAVLSVQDCSPECVTLVRDYGYNLDGTYIRDMWKDIEAVLDKSPELDTCMDGDHKFFEGEIYPCFGDCFEDKAVAEICGSDFPLLDLMDRVEDLYIHEKEDILDHVLYAVEENITPLYPGGLTGKQETLMRELVEENISFKYPYQHFLDQEVDVDITVDTGDGNYDFVLNTWTPAYGGETEGEISPKASIRWLAETQGYTEKQLREALMEGDMGDPHGFLESMRAELANAVSHMNALVFLVKMTLGDLIHLHHMMEKQYVDGKQPYDATQILDCDSISIKKKARAGLYDGWSGAGGVLEIQLEKDLELPVKFIDTADPDRAHSKWTCSISNVYSIPSSCWISNAVSFHGPIKVPADDLPNGTNVMLGA